MKALSNNWLTEGLIDFEYKKYVLLAYLQGVKSNFSDKKLYPVLSDLIFHFQNLILLKDNKQLIKNAFPERLSQPDFEKLQMIYENIVDDGELMEEIESIISFAIPEFKVHLSNGKELYENFESKMQISPIGLSPLHPDEGYLFVSEIDSRLTRIYEYQITIFQSVQEQYRGVHTRFLEAQRRGVGNSYENMKVDLIKRFKKLPNPGTYLIESKIEIPLDESLLPIAKRLLVKYVSSTAI
ncbi:MAG: hypothetical protein ACKVOU_08530 [Cytophagales bacterium]